MTTPESRSDEGRTLSSRGYRITVDDGRDSFYAISLEDPDNDAAWIMSDTVRTLDEMQ
ncbi:hypothetical protein [Natrinema salinisoli]|uniref:hypothetical protein n=1 Tax=Natrinema salinisoli TaxID=2878535 RepID=UPI001CF0740F|nr:hypothetical protein [Natrinema salinisoli]